MSKIDRYKKAHKKEWKDWKETIKKEAKAKAESLKALEFDSKNFIPKIPPQRSMEEIAKMVEESK